MGFGRKGKRSPSSRAKLGKKRAKRERKILSFEETARVLVRIEEPYRLIIETRIATGARISEVLGLMWKHVNLTTSTIKIEQRVWYPEIGRPRVKIVTGYSESGIWGSVFPPWLVGVGQATSLYPAKTRAGQAAMGFRRAGRASSSRTGRKVRLRRPWAAFVPSRKHNMATTSRR